MSLKTIMNSAIIGLVFSGSLACAQEAAPEKAASAPEQAASAPTPAPEQPKAKCQLSWKSVAGAVLGSATAKYVGKKGSNAGIDGLGKPSGTEAQAVIAPECARP